jgi:hypothetical protein
VFAHRGFDQNWLAQLRFPQLGFDLGGTLIDAAATASAARASGLAIPSVNRPVNTARKVG